MTGHWAIVKKIEAYGLDKWQALSTEEKHELARKFAYEALEESTKHEHQDSQEAAKDCPG